MYLVSDAYGEAGNFANHSEYLRFRDKVNKKDTLKVDMSLSEKLYRFRGKILKIEYDIPPIQLLLVCNGVIIVYLSASLHYL